MKVYKINDTKEPGVVVIKVGGVLSEIEHKMISEMPGDLFFIFPKIITQTINPEKFSNLYGATWYGIYEEDDVNGFWEAFDYIESITKYLSVSAVLKNYMVRDSELKSLRNLQYSGIETSVFSSRDLTRKEKENIYLIKPRIIDLVFGWRFKVFGSSDNKGTYSKHITEDSLIFLRPRSINEIRKNLSQDILHSFYGLGPWSFIASLIPKETYINLKVDETKV